MANRSLKSRLFGPRLPANDPEQLLRVFDSYKQRLIWAASIFLTLLVALLVIEFYDIADASGLFDAIVFDLQGGALFTFIFTIWMILVIKYLIDNY